MGTLVREHGVNSFKHFMAYKNAIMCDDETLVNSFSRALELGAIADRPCRERRARCSSCRRRSRSAASPAPKATRCRARPKSRARPPTAPSASPKCSSVPLYIVHVSCSESPEAITRARAEGPARLRRGARRPSADRRHRSTAIPTSTRAAAHVMSPPFRPQRAPGRAVARPAVRQPADHRHRSLLLLRAAEGGGQGRLHARSPTARGGIEDRMAVLWHHGVNTGRLTPNEFVRVTSTNAAQIFNIYPRKGSVCGRRRCRPRGLGPGGDARPSPRRRITRRSTSTSSRA